MEIEAVEKGGIERERERGSFCVLPSVCVCVCVRVCVCV